jgi:hypothetical protein
MGKNILILFQIPIKHLSIAENEINKEFSRLFKKFEGNEYYTGNIQHMIIIFTNISMKYMINDIFDMQKIKHDILQEIKHDMLNEIKKEDKKVEDKKVEDKKVEDKKVEDKKVEDKKVEDKKVEDKKVEDKKVEVEQFLKTLLKTQLQQICEIFNLSMWGIKEKLIERIISEKICLTDILSRINPNYKYFIKCNGFELCELCNNKLHKDMCVNCQYKVKNYKKFQHTYYTNGILTQTNIFINNFPSSTIIPRNTKQCEKCYLKSYMLGYENKFFNETVKYIESSNNNLISGKVMVNSVDVANKLVTNDD